MTYNVFGGTLSLTQSINHYQYQCNWLIAREDTSIIMTCDMLGGMLNRTN